MITDTYPLHNENNISTSQNDYEEVMPGLRNLYSPDKDQSSHVQDVADILLEMGVIDQDRLFSIRDEFGNNSKEIIVYLEKNSIVSIIDVLKAKAKLYNLEFLSITLEDVAQEAYEKLDKDYIRKSLILPFRFDEEVLVVATSEPENVFAMDEVKRITGCELRFVVCSPEDIEFICDEFNKSDYDIDLDDIVSDIGDVEVVQDEKDDSDDLEKMAGQSPVIKYVNYLISSAIREKASDIHIEPKAKYSKVRYRIDGSLFETMQVPAKMHPAVVSRLKIMSNLDISERRLPQDGKVAVIVGGRSIDLRISILPTTYGEKVVIRVLDSKSILRGLDASGMSAELLERFERQVNLPNGVFLVTGPTGSGKSTTLYSAMGMMNGDGLNISTVEDPVEYNLEFCSQIQVQDKIGMSFSAALRSLLRQDPDIIMLGEIRDAETAQIAVRAALTGHLVLSTLHTNDAPSSITRLVNIGIDAYLIAAALNGVLAQRLIRRVCDNCKQEYEPNDFERSILEKHGKSGQFFKGEGCEHCRDSGYAGRVGIFELLEITDSFRDVINEDPSIDNMRRTFHDQGSKSLFDDGIEKACQGLTTIEEVLRVTQG